MYRHTELRRIGLVASERISIAPGHLTYMLEHRAAVQQEADLSRLPRQAVGRAVEGRRRLSLDREQVLARLWEIAKLSPEMTRNSITGQVKALSMVIAMQNFIPDRKAVPEKKSPTTPAKPQIYEAQWLRKQRARTTEPLPSPVPPAPPAPASLGRAVERAAGRWPQSLHLRQPL